MIVLFVCSFPTFPWALQDRSPALEGSQLLMCDRLLLFAKTCIACVAWPNQLNHACTCLARALTLADVNELPVLNAVIKESLRLLPPAPLATFRCTKIDTEVSDQTPNAGLSHLGESSQHCPRGCPAIESVSTDLPSKVAPQH